MASAKNLAVVRMARVQGKTERVAMVPWCVRAGGKANKFRGMPCERTVILSSSAFEKKGLTVLLDLLGRAPLEEDDPLEGYTTVSTEKVFELGMRAASAMTYVTTGPTGPVLGRVQIRPAKASYLSGEVLHFVRIEQAAFMEAMERLLPK
jgi:hypothetical protein